MDRFLHHKFFPLNSAENFQSSYYVEHLLTTASVYCKLGSPFWFPEQVSNVRGEGDPDSIEKHLGNT